MSHPDSRLTDMDIEKIREKIKKLRTTKNIVNRDIQDDVFTLLENECKVFYYPVPDEMLWAFYQRFEYPDGNPRKFVFINTNLPYEKQIFAAAHELAHVWQVADDIPEILISSEDGDMPVSKAETGSVHPSKKELIANRFAAEFLMDAETVRKLYMEQIRKDTRHADKIKQLVLVLILMDYYIAPYKMTVKRLEELDLITAAEAESLLEIPREGENSIRQVQTRFGLCEKNNDITRVKKFANFIDLAIQDYQKERITFSKLKQLLSIFGATPEEMGIAEDAGREFFTEEELDALLEDE